MRSDDERLDILARAETLRLLYQQSFPAIFASLLTAVMVCILMWPVQRHELLLGWFAVLLASSCVRFMLFVRYWQRAPRGEVLLAWEKPYFLTLLSSSLIWGIGAVIIMPANSQLHQLSIYVLLIGMSGGAIAVYSAHRAMTLTTIACIILPSALWFLLQGTLISSVLTVSTLLFAITTVQTSKVLSSAMYRSFRLGFELQDARQAAEDRARRDSLTGLHNRRAFYEQGEKLLKESSADSRQLAVILSDVDHFKKINDKWGHLVGDKVLKQVAEAHRVCLRSDDLCARLGGEEFGVLLLVDEVSQAREVAELLRTCLEETRVEQRGQNISVTASFGVAVGKSDLEILFCHADAALYRAKDEGRNRVVCQE